MATRLDSRGRYRPRPENPLSAAVLEPEITALAERRPRLNVPTPMPQLSAPAESRAFSLSIDSLSDPEVSLDAMQAELESVHAEMNLLRRRDETLKFYMTRLDDELRLAAKLQQDFLPKKLPQVGPIYFHTLFRPAGYVSGDLYDVIRLDETNVGFFLVDAVGHGMPAALLTMFIKRALVYKEISDSGYRLLAPCETMRRINDALVEQCLSQATFATATYGIINTQTLQLTLATGGHPTPLLLRGEELTDLPGEGPLLGIFEGETYSQSTVQLQPGDRLFVYSDGIEVAFNEDMATHKNQWRRELFDRRGLPSEGLLIDFSDRLDQEAGSLQPKDDLTLLVVEVK